MLLVHSTQNHYEQEFPSLREGVWIAALGSVILKHMHSLEGSTPPTSSSVHFDILSLSRLLEIFAKVALFECALQLIVGF